MDWLIFQSGPKNDAFGASDLVRQPFDGSRPPERLTSHTNSMIPDFWTPDGQHVVFTRSGQPGPRNIAMLPMEGDPEHHLIVASEATECCSMISPDGNQIYSAGSDGTIRVWNLVSCGLVRSIDAHAHGVTALSLTPDGHSPPNGNGFSSVLKVR